MGRPAGGTLRAGLARHLPSWEGWAFALHAALCALLALWLAMRLELDALYWAGSTVLITAQASRSQGLLKGLNRLIGTVVGTVAGVTLIALFPQGWWSYLAAHTAWLALCTFVSCLLKDQQSYAAALCPRWPSSMDWSRTAPPRPPGSVPASRCCAVRRASGFSR